jgi:hypothetical protein
MPTIYLQFSFFPRKHDYVTNNARAGDYVTTNTRAGHYHPKRQITNTFTLVDSQLFVRTLNRILQNGRQGLPVQGLSLSTSIYDYTAVMHLTASEAM